MKTKKIIIIIIIIVLLLGAIGYAGYWGYNYFFNNNDQENTNQADDEDVTLDTPQVPFDKSDLDTPPEESKSDKTTTDDSTKTDKDDNSTVKEVANIPIYPKSTMRAYTDEDEYVSATYKTPKGATGKTVLDYYAEELPDLGWNKVSEDSNRSAIYKNANNKKVEIWIYYSNKEEGTDYVVEFPPFTSISN
ncbi:MAG: hypothetical protein ABIE68_04965 [bacterium]